MSPVPGEVEALGPELRRLLERFRAGERGALARAISVVEDERPGFQRLLHDLISGGLRGRRIGVTGPPGAGKSSLVAGLCERYRKAGGEVGVVAVDPTSPFSGGALLGDRIRMGELATDPGIFIRSMATRGSLGGLATTSKEVLDLMDAFGFRRVLVETVGVGQTELEITAAADTVIVVLVPESGDAIQAMKAGLMEIADIFVVNKADRPGADRLVREIGVSLRLRQGEALKDVPAHHGVDLSAVEPAGREGAPGGEGSEEGGGGGDADGWEIPVLKTVASVGKGVEEVVEAIDAHGRHLERSGELARRRRARAESRVREVVERELRRVAWKDGTARRALLEGLERISAGEATAYSVAADVLRGVLGEAAAAEVAERLPVGGSAGTPGESGQRRTE